MSNEFHISNYNPDVLSCLANLSNDEIFTPPSVVNSMLDMLPQELFADPKTTFLDPVCKSGVFLREIAKRLIVSLAHAIPNPQDRIDHIFHQQLFGIAITELTSLISRRSTYCSKNPNGKYAISHFDDIHGNIRFNRIRHSWIGKRCKYCGASKNEYDRSDDRESYAYEFIHTTSPEDIFKMKFDVIIGNPPYQLSDSGAFASATPIYNKFVSQAKKLNPRFISMIIPSRWFAGGKGLDAFRSEMLNDNRVYELHDFPIASDCFPGTRISGGVCYFLWTRDTHGDCRVYSHNSGNISYMKRPLLEKNTDTFIRINEAISIFRKVQSFNEGSFSSIVSPRKPFGLASDFISKPSKYGLPSVREEYREGDITIIGTYKYKTVKRYAISSYPFPNGQQYIGKYKVFVSNVLDNGFDWTKERLRPFLGNPNDVCTETFLCVGLFDTKEEAENVISYMNTKLFHLLMHLKKVSHHVVSKVYELCPLQDFHIQWDDAKLYAKYGLSTDEIQFIETHIKPMPTNGGET